MDGSVSIKATDPLESRSALGRNLTFGLLDVLGRMIVTGAYDGRPFPIEAELSKEHAVSRSVTREAIKMLPAQGLLAARPRQGTIITPPSAWNWFDTDVLRWLLERKFSLSLLRQFTGRVDCSRDHARTNRRRHGTHRRGDSGAEHLASRCER